MNMFWIGRSALRGVRLANDVKRRTILSRSARKLLFTASTAKKNFKEVNVGRVQAMKDSCVCQDAG